MGQTHLFSQYELYGNLQRSKERMQERVVALKPDQLLGVSVDTTVERLVAEASVDLVILDEEHITAEHAPAQIDVSHDFNYGMMGGRQEVEGTRFSFFVPFAGDGQLFQCYGNTRSSLLPRGVVDGQELVIRYDVIGHDAKQVKSTFDHDLQQIKKHLEWLRELIEPYNRELPSLARAAVERRREKLIRDQGTAAALGVPLRRREGAPTTYVAPTRRRTTPVTARATSTSGRPFVAEPALDSAEYEHILTIVSSMVAVMERSPHAFCTLGEEDLRTHFLVQLNGQYEGMATGETFNYTGRTDILIRVDGKNIFVAECKFWEGAKGFTDGIDQLLGYAAWRDTKLALLVFNRNQNFSAVVKQIPQLVKAHAQFVRQLTYPGETGFRFTLRRPDDSDREMTLTVLAFDVPRIQIDGCEVGQ